MKRYIKHALFVTVTVLSLGLLLCPTAIAQINQVVVHSEFPKDEGGGIFTYAYLLFNQTGSTKTVTEFSLEGPAPEATISAHAEPSTDWEFFYNGSTRRVGWKWVGGGDGYPLGTGVPNRLSGFSYTVNREPRQVSWEVKTTSGTYYGDSEWSAVPVELQSFSIRQDGASVVVSWTTASEIENLGFYIYRSEAKDGHFTPLHDKIIAGAGNSLEPHDYSFNDSSVEAAKTYYYKLVDINYNGVATFHGPVKMTVGELPDDYALDQNYPNPFNPETSISYMLKAGGLVKLTIYNTLGQLVRTLVEADQQAGSYSVLWNGRDAAGQRVASGVYVYRLDVNGFSQVKKLVVEN